jgi:hypothetical protein
MLVCLAVASAAGATDAGLRVTVDRWSRTIATEAHSVSLAAQRRHPRRMTYSALRFGRVALRARAAVAGARPTTARGRRAQHLALVAFQDYAKAGRGWAATGRARLAGKRLVATREARIAAGYAKAGNRLLVSAGKLLP